MSADGFPISSHEGTATAFTFAPREIISERVIVSFNRESFGSVAYMRSSVSQ